MDARNGAVVAAALAGLSLLAAGCGGGAAPSGVASVATTTSTTTHSSSASSGPASFSACMRAHGVPNFPDPSGQGGIQINGSSGIDPRSAQFQAAQRTCQKLLPNRGKVSPAQQAKAQAQMLKFSACMRAHGVRNFPDPTFSGGEGQLKIGPSSRIDPNSGQFKAAQQACQKLLPGLPTTHSTSTGK